MLTETSPGRDGGLAVDRCELFGGRLVLTQPRRGYRFSVDALLLAWWVEFAETDKIMDAGCGVGVVALLLTHLRGARDVTGVDIQEELITLARANARANGVSATAKFFQNDLRSLPPEHHGRYDVFCANPPFREVGSGRVCPDNSRAVARHELALTLADLANAAAAALKPGGRYFLIHKPRRLDDVRKAFGGKGLPVTRIRLVHPYTGAAANLVLVAGMKGEGAGAETLPPLFIYESPGRYGPELRTIYAGEGHPLYAI